MKLFIKNIKISRVVIALLILLFINTAKSQEKIVLKWIDPLAQPELSIMGQAWSGETALPYDRLPARAESTVREEVWDLSRNSAGLVIRFKSNAKNIKVEYGVTDNFSMTHMPASGVSGVDLYAINSDSNWLWCAGRRSFSDTVRYSFEGISPPEEYLSEGLEYRLYLPPYNTVKWLRIGVPNNSKIFTLPKINKKPIVAYGTSITQGACASRPGMAWTALLERELNIPVINLGFSGNGWLDKEVIELIGEIDAEVYILDCMPNMTAPRFTDEEVRERIISSVKYLQEKHPNTPILLTEHDGYTDGVLRLGRYKNYNDINITLRKTFKDLKKSGVLNIFLLPQSEIGMNIDNQVDGIHPNDLGMYKYAQAYNKYIRVILGINK